MLDIKRIRNDFDEVAKKLATRGVAAEKLVELKELDDKRRELLVKSESAKAERNTASAAIAQAKRNKEDASEQIAAMQKLSADIKANDAELAEIDDKLAEFTTTLPNIPAADVPVGADEDENEKFAVGEHLVTLTLTSKLTGILVKTLAFLTGNVVPKLLALASFSTKTWCSPRTCYLQLYVG